MDVNKTEAFSTKHIGHLGLVADKIRDLKLVELIDELLPISKEHGAKISHGERVMAMILNGLGFVDSRLYLFPEFLADKSIELLYGRDIKAEWFNDDALGRCLDAISEYGATKLFTTISLAIGQAKDLLGKSINIDTTTLAVYGDYEVADEECEEPRPMRGYSKCKRNDLKQMILLLATTGAAHFPLWMESYSGNASDQVTMPSAAEKIRILCKGLKGSDEFIYVGDSAFYANILEKSEHMKWITRVPERVKEAKNFTQALNCDWIVIDDKYQYCEKISRYGDVKQRWVLFRSEAGYHREKKTFDKKIQKEDEAQQKQCWHLGNQIFACEKDARKAAEKRNKELKYHEFAYEIRGIKKHAGKGRPKTGAEAVTQGYQIEYTLKLDEIKINTESEKLGRFVLSTNEMDEQKLSCIEILNEYKSQSGVEQGFKFIKNNTFEVDSIFLKTPSRIEALMMVMTLCLMVYGVSEYDLRKSLTLKNETVRNQMKKQIQNPTMQWIYFLFRNVNELYKKSDASLQKIVINVSGELAQIVRHFGEDAKIIYQVGV